MGEPEAGNDIPLDHTLTRAAADPVNQLEYIADMILELQQMASRCGYGKLTMMLALAEAEVRDLTRAERNRDARP